MAAATPLMALDLLRRYTERRLNMTVERERARAKDDPGRRGWPLYLLAFVLFVLFSLRLDASANYEEDLRRTGVQATGVVQEISGRVRRARVDVSYSAAGRPQRAHFFSTHYNRWHVGDTATVYYDRDKPSRMVVPGEASGILFA